MSHKWLKRLLTSLLLLLLLAVLPMAAQADFFGGSCGKHASWSLDTESGDLLIYGTGDMDHYTYNTQPWVNQKYRVKSIMVMDGITGIGDNAFNYFPSATTLILPDTLQTIGNNAFFQCSKLEYVTIPNSVTAIGKEAFSQCSSLKEVVLSENLTSIPDGLFSSCTLLSSLVIPQKVVSIGMTAFRFCNNLTSVTMPAGLTYLGNYAFQDCYKLASLSIPYQITSIGDTTFSNCYGFKSAGPYGSGCDLEFGWNREIPANALKGCSGLEKLILPDGLTSIGENAFANCSGLTYVQVPSTVTTIGGGAFGYCRSMKLISLPQRMRSIDQGAFRGCSSLLLLEIPDGITELKDYIMSDCTSLLGVVLPASLQTIRPGAFKGCSMLQEVYYAGTREQLSQVVVWYNNDPLFYAEIYYGFYARMGDVQMSADGRTVFIEKPIITGNSWEVSIAYNIYDSDGNPVNYFYSNEPYVAATCPYNGRFNVYVVVTDLSDNSSITLMTGWFDVDGYQEMTVEDPEWKMSADGKSCFIMKPAITGASGAVTIAYNIYDADGNAINYFYSNEAAVAATCPYDGTFNVYVVVTDASGASQTVMTGWFEVYGYGTLRFESPVIYDDSEDWELEDVWEEPAVSIELPPEPETEIIPVMDYEGAA